MTNGQRRRQIAWEAARMMCYHEEREFFRARWKAAIRVCGGTPAAKDLPGNREIQEEIRKIEEALKQDAFGLTTAQTGRTSVGGERFRLFETLLTPLEQLRQDPVKHPEGDVLYHSLQVFQLAQEELPYDEEFLLSALLHDVGKAIDPKDHVAAGLDALGEAVTPRTAWLIEHHVEALDLQEGKLGVRSRRRLEVSEDFRDLMLLADCDRKGRVRGVLVPDVLDALEYVRELDNAWEEETDQ
jgi:hypothetical protein